MKAFITGCVITFALMTVGRHRVVQLFDQSTKVAGEGVAWVASGLREVAK